MSIDTSEKQNYFSSISTMKKDQSYGLVVLKETKSSQDVENNWEVLLVQHKGGKHRSLPKGHPESNETRQETAIREVLEETGVEVCPDRLVPGISFEEHYTFYSSFDKIKVDKTVIYFLAILPEGSKKSSEHKPIVIQDLELLDAVWLSLSKAIEKATHKATKNILGEAIDYLKKK